MSVSFAPVFRSTMVALIKTALASQSGVEIAYGSIPSDETDDFILIRSVTARSDYADAVGAQRMYEILDLEVIISCARGGDNTQQTASERAWSLLALIETRLRSDSTLGGLCYKARRTRVQEIETQADEEATGREANLHITFTAELKI